MRGNMQRRTKHTHTHTLSTSVGWAITFNKKIRNPVLVCWAKCVSRGEGFLCCRWVILRTYQAIGTYKTPAADFRPELPSPRRSPEISCPRRSPEISSHYKVPCGTPNAPLTADILLFRGLSPCFKSHAHMHACVNQCQHFSKKYSTRGRRCFTRMHARSHARAERRAPGQREQVADRN